MAMKAAGEGTVGKAMDVLDRVACFGRPVRFTELLETSPYPKATLYRLLQVLTQQGMLSVDKDRNAYRPGIRLVRLAHAAWTASSLAPLARPHLDALSRRIGETLHLAQLDHGQVLYVDKRNASRPIKMFSEAGKVGPAYCTGVGKAMLAFLDDEELERNLEQQCYHRFTPSTLADVPSLRGELSAIRKRGYAFDREEHEPGIICVAMPILTTHGQVLGALSVTSSTVRTDLDGLAAQVPLIRPVAERIAKEAEDWHFPEDGEKTMAAGGA